MGHDFSFSSGLGAAVSLTTTRGVQPPWQPRRCLRVPEPLFFRFLGNVLCPAWATGACCVVSKPLFFVDTGWRKAHVCTSNGHDVDMHGTASAWHLDMGARLVSSLIFLTLFCPAYHFGGGCLYRSSWSKRGEASLYRQGFWRGGIKHGRYPACWRHSLRERDGRQTRQPETWRRHTHLRQEPSRKD